MRLETLDDVCLSIVDGPFGSNLKTSDYVEFGVPVLQGKNITGDRFEWKEIRYISEQKARELIRSSAAIGDHIVIKIGSIGYSAILDDLNGHEFAIIPANLARLRPDKSKIDDRFLHHWLKSEEMKRYFRGVASSTAQPALSLSKIREAPIPLPPLEEQKRVAAILDQADALRLLRARALDRLNSLGQAIFHEMFGHNNASPLKSISEFAAVKGGKRLPKGSDYSEGSTPHPYIRVSDLGGLRIDTTAIKYISPEIQRSVWRYTVSEGDVIISIAGSIGLTAAVPPELDGANLTENAAKITPKVGSEFDPIYLSWALSMPEAKAQISASTGQVTIGKLALFRIEQIEVPMPEIHRQREFSKALSEVDTNAEALQRSGNELEALFASLQHRAFQGKL